jgi:hypothetical protein
MRSREIWRYSRLATLSLVLVIAGASTALAQSSSSSSYKITEAQLGGGGSNAESCSGQYCAKTTIGSGSSGPSSTPGTVQFTPPEDNQPRLELIVEPGQSNLGIVGAEATANKTSVIKINNYLVGGYTLQIFGDPPKFSGHTINAMSTKGASVIGREQFGINLATNTTPNVGSAPQQVPSDTITFGQAEDDYNDPNFFKYVSGEVIARSNAESGRTDYTITFIFNISASTPAGNYNGEYTAVVIPAF